MGKALSEDRNHKKIDERLFECPFSCELVYSGLLETLCCGQPSSDLVPSHRTNSHNQSKEGHDCVQLAGSQWVVAHSQITINEDSEDKLFDELAHWPLVMKTDTGDNSHEIIALQITNLLRTRLAYHMDRNLSDFVTHNTLTNISLQAIPRTGSHVQ